MRYEPEAQGEIAARNGRERALKLWDGCPGGIASEALIIDSMVIDLSGASERTLERGRVGRPIAGRQALAFQRAVDDAGRYAQIV